MRKLLVGIVLVSLLMVWGCSRHRDEGEDEQPSVMKLPYQESVGTLTQYKNFIRGSFELSKERVYVLEASWAEEGELVMYCRTKNDYQDVLTVASGTPVTVEVPADGLYRIHAPLKGDAITNFKFSLAEAESS